jgi:hypothetical protein
MGSFRLKLNLRQQCWENLDELDARLQDFSPVFANIIGEWARGNVDKFAKGRGAEMTGADQPPTTWEAVTEKYHSQKMKKFTDWLMVRTGELMSSLTTRGAFGEFTDEHRAIFGTPLDSSDADKAMYNSDKRPTIFLGRTDRLMIERELQNYLNLGKNYKDILFATGKRRMALKTEMRELDIQFAEAVNG